jgi:hypothetical protein
VQKCTQPTGASAHLHVKPEENKENKENKRKQKKAKKN